MLSAQDIIAGKAVKLHIVELSFCRQFTLLVHWDDSLLTDFDILL